MKKTLLVGAIILGVIGGIAQAAGFKCTFCNGTGFQGSFNCAMCKGSGRNSNY